jgi:uncharacterized protein (DUF1330 family)
LIRAMKALASVSGEAQAIIKASGGRQVAIGGAGGAGAKPVTAIQGTPPKRVVIQAWDSMDVLKKWFNSPEYQEALKIGIRAMKAVASENLRSVHIDDVVRQGSAAQ